MGLDMYLSKKTYVKNWKHMQPSELNVVTVTRGGEVRTDIKPERVSYIIEQVAYWRKANAIHRWFVHNVQDGKDECQESHVPVEKLAELVALCKQVLSAIKEPGRAALLLPTQGGFFFGNTSYGDDYVEDLKDTIRQLEPLLSESSDDYGSDFYYRSSW